MGNHRIWPVWPALCLALLSGCLSGENCTQDPKISSPAAQQMSPNALRIAQALPALLLKRAQETVENQRQIQHEKNVRDRKEADAAYQAAVERRDKSAQPPKASLHLQPNSFDLPQISRPSLISEIYGVESEQVRQFFVRNHQLTPAAHVLIETLKNVDDHALDPADFDAEKFQNAGERLEKMNVQLANPDAFKLNPWELHALSRSVDSNARESEILDILCDFERTPIPRVAATCERIILHYRELTELSDRLEYTLADAWLAYAFAMGYGNTEKFSNEERQKYASQDNPDIHPKYYERIIEARLAEATVSLFENPSADAVSEKLGQLVPKHEQYAKLQQLRDRYRQIISDGGWAVVPPDRMFAGGHAPLVKNLKQRLAVEGYYTGNIDDAFDAGLTEAIRKYQKHHQIEETGAVNEVFWRSLNVPATQRLAEIESNIRRWHKTMFEPRDKYIYINIPSFEVELWADGKRISSHRTVVGSSTRICNTRTQEWELMNATRLMHSRMTYLVFNPYWNVPPRIEVDEYNPKMAADPKWLENSDFEYYTPRGGGRILRQKPGPTNALGQVKLIFPNKHNTYLHDTPKQEMFNYPIRAFSHGCIRVEGAFEFAKEVLTLDDQWDEAQIQRFFKESGEHPVDLKTPIDVFIEYHTVTVDDDGDAYFLADVYKIIRDEISPPTAQQRRCNPATDRTSQFRSGAGEDSGP